MGGCGRWVGWGRGWGGREWRTRESSPLSNGMGQMAAPFEIELHSAARLRAPTHAPWNKLPKTLGLGEW